jgi:hypothetical protein
MGSACELECEAILTFDLAFITEAWQERILAVLIEIKRMLSVLISSLVVPSRRHQGRANRRTREAAPTQRDGSSGS